MGSFIKIDQKMLKWEWYKNEHTKNVFLHCLLKAYWKDMKIEGKTIPRGSFVSSIGNIAEELALTPMEVRTALKHLKLTNEVTSKGTNRNTVFTVTNYDLYQAKEQTEQQTDNKQITNEQQSDNEQITNKEQTVNKLLTTNEEYKEDKNDKEYKEGEECKNENNVKKEKNTPETQLQMLERLSTDFDFSDLLLEKSRDWISYKIEKKDKYTERGMKSLLGQIEKYSNSHGDIAVIDLIDLCMSNNWKGIIWEKISARNVNGMGRSSINWDEV